MAVKIRMSRHGRKKQPFYRIVVQDSEAPRDGKFLEIVGTMNPMVEPNAVDIKMDKVQYWLDQGAKPSDTVKSLLKKHSAEAVATPAE